ncbi:DUF4352 domain-containing protein [Streptomyces sp. B21-083]|uniref:DUF4352 domain-containing protein n=1 Tax=Streptomyces sp. B21-083 TaxID=3039410 RepID=UPI002FF03F73
MHARARLAAVTMTAILALTACSGGSTVTDTPKDVPAAKSTPKTPASKPAAPKVAKVGDTIALVGAEDGSELDVTVVKVADPAKSSDEFTAPDAGNRWIGVQFQLLNTGTAAYNDSPGNGVKIADSQGQQFTSVFADITAGPSMGSSVTLKPGAKALGWIVFEVPKESKGAVVQFTMDSGFADQTGEWALS